MNSWWSILKSKKRIEWAKELCVKRILLGQTLNSSVFTTAWALNKDLLGIVLVLMNVNLKWRGGDKRSHQHIWSAYLLRLTWNTPASLTFRACWSASLHMSLCWSNSVPVFPLFSPTIGKYHWHQWFYLGWSQIINIRTYFFPHSPPVWGGKGHSTRVGESISTYDQCHKVLYTNHQCNEDISTAP